MLISKRAFSKVFRAICLILAAGFLSHETLDAAVLTNINPTIINVGSGPDLSYLVIDESTLYSTPLEFIYHYTFDSNNLISAQQMMQYITNATSLGFTIGSQYGEMESLSYRGITISGTDFSLTDGFYWSYFVVGGLDGGSAPADANQWNYADSGISTGRTIAQNSWDGFTLSGWGANSAIGGAPSVAIAAIPEPMTLPLVLLSLTILFALSGSKPLVKNE